MAAPPDHVLTGVLRGGPLDGLVVEIDEGTETLDFGPPLVVLGDASESVDTAEPLGSYRYAGEVDADGNAVYVFDRG